MTIDQLKAVPKDETIETVDSMIDKVYQKVIKWFVKREKDKKINPRLKVIRLPSYFTEEDRKAILSELHRVFPGLKIRLHSIYKDFPSIVIEDTK